MSSRAHCPVCGAEWRTRIELDGQAVLCGECEDARMPDCIETLRIEGYLDVALADDLARAQLTIETLTEFWASAIRDGARRRW